MRYLKGFVIGFWVNGLFFQDGQDAHGFLEEVDASGQVHAKVHSHPFNPLTHVFLLLQHEHVMVEELLKFLIDEVDHQLLQSVELEDLKSSNVQDTNEVHLKENH